METKLDLSSKSQFRNKQLQESSVYLLEEGVKDQSESKQRGRRTMKNRRGLQNATIAPWWWAANPVSWCTFKSDD